MTHARLWILNGRVPEPCLDIGRWARWYETAELKIASAELMGGDLVIVTAFRAFSNRHGAFDPPPMLFDTIVYGSSYLGQMLGRPTAARDRIETRCYASWAEAELGHAEIVERYLRLAETAMNAAGAAINRALPGGNSSPSIAANCSMTVMAEKARRKTRRKGRI
jgi:hypothetical protein